MVAVLKLGIIAAMLLTGILLVGFIVYFYQGSLEMFPTEEQQDKVRTVTGVAIVILTLAEGLMFLIYRKIRG